MSVTAGVNDVVIAVRDKLRGKIGQTKVKRYWPGKAPEWADEAEEDDDLRPSHRPQSSAVAATAAALERAFPTRADDPGLVVKDDPRLRRLAESRADDKEEARAIHRRIRHAEVVSTAEEERPSAADAMEVDEEDEEAMEERRRRIREKLLLRQQEEVLPPVEEESEAEEESEDEDESEYETDSDDEQVGLAMVKPIFVPKSERDTIAERERVEAEERALEELAKRRLEQRKVETKQILVEEIRKDEEIRRNLEAEDGDAGEVDTDDEANEAEEYEAWKAREMGRIKREREDREARLREREEVEKVRAMTEEERREWERRNPKPQPPPKQKWKFMQKYYHKGAFFQADADDPATTAGQDAIYHRDFSEATGEDKLNKTILPKVMQVKSFGRSGRTKWTHLVNEDTTVWSDESWNKEDDRLRHKYRQKMAAIDKPIERPRGSKKMKDWGN
ncbi:hypothetical protein QJS04_geneDACA009456 [Acorus gramineus]|uniref:Micro-fibrillar-associated protein 1 C-terminal domain-containing protein n=1 Tax=Acorus gramineus TaxID=55184 RepID=A0AAV9AJ07_ACOGR|nr:hypothetical protein QJS04_geneDACA009456 [Acorus gramineus]